MTPPVGHAPQEPSSNSSEEEEFHTGYDIESGVLARVREWTDVFPWLRLGRTLRAVGSPPLLILVALTLAIWSAGVSQIAPAQYNYEQAWRSVTVRGALQSEIELPASNALQRMSWMLGEGIKQSAPVSLFSPNQTKTAFWRIAAAVLWSLLIWMPVTLLLLRQGALLTAARPMVGFTDGLKAAMRRCLAAWLMAIVPLVCVCAIGFALIIAGWVSRLGLWIQSPVSWVAALIAVICGVLAFGSYFAVPFGWSALANEKDPDVLDSLSRGYEYVYRRPLQLTLYCLVSLIVLVIVVFFAEGISLVGGKVSTAMMSLGGTSETMIKTTQANIRLFTVVVLMTSFWTLVGGVYLLLRRDACGQEVEDIWLPTPPGVKSLPKLPSDN